MHAHKTKTHSGTKMLRVSHTHTYTYILKERPGGEVAHVSQCKSKKKREKKSLHICFHTYLHTLNINQKKSPSSLTYLCVGVWMRSSRGAEKSAAAFPRFSHVLLWNAPPARATFRGNTKLAVFFSFFFLFLLNTLSQTTRERERGHEPRQRSDAAFTCTPK